MTNFTGHVHWKVEASKLIGRTIVDVRYMSPDEKSGIGWDQSPAILVLDSGDLIYPSSDDEGNGGGALFGNGPALGDGFTLPQD